MKENVIQCIITAIIAGVFAYCGIVAIPLLVLIVVMIIDYATGLVSAYITSQLNSRIGIVGIVKKISYLGLVAVGMVADYIIYSALSQIGINIDLGYLIVIWLIINELISILENLAEIGVPLPTFITKLIKRLKNTVESKIE